MIQTGIGCGWLHPVVLVRDIQCIVTDRPSLFIFADFTTKNFRHQLMAEAGGDYALVLLVGVEYPL